MTPLPAIMASPESLLVKANRLRNHCLDLDGTDVHVIRIPEAHDRRVERECPEFGNLFNNLQFSALQLAIEHAGRQPFIWLEQDSIPLNAGWASVISAEYKEAGKQFMLSSDTYPPHDLVGGIGVYGSDSHWLLPKWIEHHGWDRWMIDNLPDLIHRTPVIQHNYCKWDYELKKCGRKWMFPMDAKIIRPDAVIFHSDPSQSLLSCFSHVAA